LLEDPAEIGLTAKSAADGDFFDALVGGSQQALGALQAQIIKELLGRDAVFGTKGAKQRRATDMKFLGHFGDGQGHPIVVIEQVPSALSQAGARHRLRGLLQFPHQLPRQRNRRGGGNLCAGIL